MNAAGKNILQLSADGSGVYLHGRGASAEGDRPFVSVMSVKDGESKRVWQSEAEYFELPTDILDATGPTILVRKEAPTLSPNYYIKNAGKDALMQVTSFQVPMATRPYRESGCSSTSARMEWI